MKFNDWLYENENFSLRLERLLEEVPTDNGGKLIKWLEAAYQTGHDHAVGNLMDDGK
jgi:hypothetical protein